jgi:hypothetical protein
MLRCGGDDDGDDDRGKITNCNDFGDAVVEINNSDSSEVS